MSYPTSRVGTLYFKAMMQTRHNSESKLRRALKKDLAFVRKFSFELQLNYEISLRETRFRANKAKSQNGLLLCFWQPIPILQHRKLFSRRMLALRNSSSSAKKCTTIILRAWGAQNFPGALLKKS